MKQVSWVRQLILATLLVALGLLAYWLQYKHQPAEESQKEMAKKMVPIKGEAVQSIRLFDGKTTYEWHCLDMAAKLCKSGDNSKWEMASPIKVRADDSNLNSLVSSIANVDSVDTIDLKDETPEKRAAILKDYGLAQDQLGTAAVRRLDVQTDKGETVLYLGATNPIGDNIFSVVERVAAGQKPSGKPDESKVYVAPNYFKNNFEHDLTYWRDKKLFNFSSGDIASFKLVNHEKNETIEAAKKDGQWTLHLKDGDVPGDIENVDSLLTGLQYLAAKDFVSDDKKGAKAKAALKGAKPFVDLILVSQPAGQKEPTEIKVTSFLKTPPGDKKKPKIESTPPMPQQGQLFAETSAADPLYELQPGARTQLSKTAKDLRLNKLITSMERFDAKRIEFSGAPIGPTPLILTQESGKWKIQPDKKDASGEKVQETFDKLTGNRIKEFLTGSAIPTGADQGLKMTLGDDKTPAKRQLLFWRKDGKLYARDLLSKRGEAFLVDSSVESGLPWNRGYYDPSAAKAK